MTAREQPAAAAATEATDATPDAGEVVVVRLGAGRFAVDLASVAEVGRMPSVTRVPGAPGWLAGVANWRGRLLPVLDLRAVLGAEHGVLGPAARLVVLTVEGVAAGLAVDAVEGTDSIPARGDDCPAGLTGPGVGLLAGQVPRDDGPIGVLDARAVLRLRDTLPRARRPA